MAESFLKSVTLANGDIDCLPLPSPLSLLCNHLTLTPRQVILYQAPSSLHSKCSPIQGLERNLLPCLSPKLNQNTTSAIQCFKGLKCVNFREIACSLKWADGCWDLVHYTNTHTEFGVFYHLEHKDRSLVNRFFLNKPSVDFCLPIRCFQSISNWGF